MECSVENLYVPENHDVVGEDDEHEVTAAGVMGAASGGDAEVAFDHAHDGFGLPALAVFFEIETNLHQSAVVALGGLCGWPTVLWRDQGFDAVLLAAQAMI